MEWDYKGCGRFSTGEINWIALREKKKMVKSQVSGRRAPCTLQCGGISVFDVIISMAGLLIPFNSSSEPGQGCQGRRTHE